MIEVSNFIMIKSTTLYILKKMISKLRGAFCPLLSKSIPKRPLKLPPAQPVYRTLPGLQAPIRLLSALIGFRCSG